MQNSRLDIMRWLWHDDLVRTTLTLDDDILELAAHQARLRGVSLGKTVSDLARRGLTAPTPSEEKSGILVFKLPHDSPLVTTADVRRIESDGV